MQLGEMIANLFAALLFICILAVVLLVSSQPLLPEHHNGKMVILLPPDTITTGSIKTSTHPNLPAQVHGNLVQPRPQHWLELLAGRGLSSVLDHSVPATHALRA